VTFGAARQRAAFYLFTPLIRGLAAVAFGSRAWLCTWFGLAARLAAGFGLPSVLVDDSAFHAAGDDDHLARYVAAELVARKDHDLARDVRGLRDLP
jgi:hypothetical protein